jgi:hypothetical protein
MVDVGLVGALVASTACSGGDGGGSASSSGAMTTTTMAMTTDAGSTGAAETGPTTGDTPTTTLTTGDADTATGTGTGTEGGESTSTGDTSTGGPPVQDPRYEALVQYAPRVWMHPEEEYFPSSVEFALPSMTRFLGGDGNYWVGSTVPLNSPSDDSLPFFKGDLANAPVYAYYADKGNDVVDLVYFFYYPYNRGKEAVDTIWGNHVGDWEHITVRLMRGPDESLTPLQVYLSAHSFGGAYDWAEVEHFEATHPVVYSAKGSHGVWSAAGDHVYMSIGEEVFGVCVTIVCIDLTDQAGTGTAWDTWNNVEGFDFVAKEGLAGATWPVWMSEAFTEPGVQPANVPGGGAIYRWGNPEDCSTLGVDISDLIGVCRLEDGPTGPVSKDVWGPDLQ